MARLPTGRLSGGPFFRDLRVGLQVCFLPAPRAPDYEFTPTLRQSDSNSHSHHGGVERAPSGHDQA